MTSVAKPRLTLVSHQSVPLRAARRDRAHRERRAFDRVTIDLAAKPDWFLAISPLGKVPLLSLQRADGSEAVLFESIVICEYIEETQRGPSFIRPIRSNARSIAPGWNSAQPSSPIYGSWRPRRDAKAFEAKRAAVVEKFARVEEALGKGPFFAGERFSLVDAVFAPIFRYFDVFDALFMISVFSPKHRKCARGVRP